MANPENSGLLGLHDKHDLLLHLGRDGHRQGGIVQVVIHPRVLRLQLHMHLWGITLQKYAGGMGNFQGQILHIDFLYGKYGFRFIAHGSSFSSVSTGRDHPNRADHNHS